MEKTPYEIAQDDFQKGHADLVRSCNYILIFNGVLIAAIITAFWEWSSGDINGTLLLNCFNSKDITCNSTSLDQMGRKILFILIIFPCFCSLASSMGVFNCGLYPRFSAEKPSIEDFRVREKAAYRWYTYVCRFIGIAVLSVFLYLLSLIFPSLTIWSAIILYPGYIFLIYWVDMFSHFGYSSKEKLFQDIKAVFDFLSQERVYEFLIILFVIILNLVLMKLYP